MVKHAKANSDGEYICPRCGDDNYRRLIAEPTIAPNYVNVFVVCKRCGQRFDFSEKKEDSANNEMAASWE